ncbi:uncharacterized protein [Narcine bancroftii]|uniref:uncharacterized protein n=1 Tax=Narcine bancroftii TaxID=1343680 RepID=UPI003831D555
MTEQYFQVKRNSTHIEGRSGPQAEHHRFEGIWALHKAYTQGGVQISEDFRLGCLHMNLTPPFPPPNGNPLPLLLWALCDHLPVALVYDSLILPNQNSHPNSSRSLLWLTARTKWAQDLGNLKKATTDTMLLKWMMTPGPVLLWKHCRPHKADPLVDQVELNSQYTFVTFPDGREDSVATRDLSPAGCVNNPEETQMSTINKERSSSH